MELLDLCRSSEEIMAILNEDEHVAEGPEESTSNMKHSLARVKLALKYEQKRVGVPILVIFVLLNIKMRVIKLY